MPSSSDLQSQWTQLYKHTLPSLAKSRDSSQPTWPVFLDHCFARIILDNAVGGTAPWTKVIKAPAVKNMSEDQLISSIELGEKIATGEVDLVELDERSLELRGKKSKAKTKSAKREATNESGKQDENDVLEGNNKRRKTGRGAEEGTISKYFAPSPKTKTEPFAQSTTPPASKEEKLQGPKVETTSAPHTSPSHRPQIAKFTSDQDPLVLISSSKALTPFRKQVLTLLCGVPAGNWTTYATLSNHITHTSHKTCARAVGNAMRNNPFAPLVPCHRVLAADGSIGGFGGSWGEEGVHAREKKELLQGEGVRFGSHGKALGRPWRGWEAEQGG